MYSLSEKETKERLEAEEVEMWIKAEEGRLMRGEEVEFNGIKVALDEGMLYFKDLKTGQFSLLPKKKGIEFDSNWKLVGERWRSGIRVYLFSKKNENIFIFELESEKEGMKVQKDEVKLPFIIGNGLIDFREGTIIAVNEKQYCLYAGKIFRSSHNIGEPIGVINLGGGKGAFAGKSELHLVKGGSRVAIEFEEKAESLRFGTGNKNYKWLVIRSNEWKGKVLAVVLEGEEEFCYAFSSFK